MAHRLELLGNVAAHTLGVGIRPNKLGVKFLDGLELPDETIKLGIRDRRVIEGVVAIGIGIEEAIELRRTGTRRLRGIGCRRLGRSLFYLRHIAKERNLPVYLRVI